MINDKDFLKVFRNVLQKINPFITKDLIAKLEVFNRGYGREGFDLIEYYSIEWEEYYRAYQMAVNKGAKKICDCGGFLGVYALVMAELGFDVSIVEALKYYDESLNNLYSILKENGIKIINFDMFETRSKIKEEFCGYDMVFSMAVIEHYPHSLKQYMDNLKRLASGGYIYITAPNIAVIHKRLSFFLRGVTPLASIKEIYDSEIPFTGHHHEMTMTEMEQLAKLSELKVIEKHFNTCYLYAKGVRKIMFYLIQKMKPDTRELLAILLI